MYTDTSTITIIITTSDKTKQKIKKFAARISKNLKTKSKQGRPKPKVQAIPGLRKQHLTKQRIYAGSKN